MGAKFSGLGTALYDSKRRQFLGRDGAGWGKLGIFYFFFYLGLAGFFCAMLAVFMALSPRDAPRYYSDSSRMQTRSNPLSPGLGFRPQPDVERNLIYVTKGGPSNGTNPYAQSLDQYLAVFYPNRTAQKEKMNTQKPDDSDDDDDDDQKKPAVDMRPQMQPFSIAKPGDCTSAKQYGYTIGKPCILVKMNKIVGYEPGTGVSSEDKVAFKAAECPKSNAGASIHCAGEYPADVDNIGKINYISEHESDGRCGLLDKNRFPYEGKIDRRDVYQAPYIWVQFTNPEPNTIINVICRIYGRNVQYDKKAGRAITRFQIYVEDLKPSKSAKKSRKTGEM